MRNFMIYGASGHTGQLLARRAVEAGLRPVLGGRNAQALAALARRLGLEYRAASIDEPRQLDRALAGLQTVLNAAGPFAATAAPMVEACLRSRTHYLDVSGELSVFAEIHRHDARARACGVLLLPGVGFLVLASDCLAAHVAQQLPGAVSLRIALSRPQFLSRGSRRTIVASIREHVLIRRGGALAQVPVGALRRRFDLGAGELDCSAINGAEVFVSALSTGIANIEIYAPASASERALYRLGGSFAQLLRTAPAQLTLNALADHWPGSDSRRSLRQVIVAIAEDAAGKKVARRLRTPDAYEATATMALAAVSQVLHGLPHTGFHTPGAVFAPELLFSLPGVSLEALASRAA